MEVVMMMAANTADSSGKMMFFVSEAQRVGLGSSPAISCGRKVFF
jgi:hypothetical protein